MTGEPRLSDAPDLPRKQRLRLSPAPLAIVALLALVSALVVGLVESHGKTAKPRALPAGAVVYVRPVTTAAAAAATTRRLNSLGVHINVTTQPATPSLVGTWLGEGGTGDVPTPLVNDVVRQAQGYTATLRIPAHFTGRITLEVGVPPAPGQKIDVGGLRNALAPGMPLACHSLSGATPADAIRVVAQLGYSIDAWTTRDSATSGLLTPAQIESRPHLRVTEAFVHDWTGNDLSAVQPGAEHHLVVKLADERSPTYIAQLWTGYSAGLRKPEPPALTGC